MTRPTENRDGKTQLTRFGLGVEESRAYWSRMAERPGAPSAEFAFENHWFGTVSESRVQTILNNMKLRYDAYPDALAVLTAWQGMDPDTRRVIVHWHVMLADALYRKFAGEYLPERRDAFVPEVRRELVVRWVEEQHPDRWAMSSRRELATRLIGAGRKAGLLKGKTDPRTLQYPRITDDALGYGLRLFRAVDIAGSFLDNPYFRSVGLQGAFLSDRILALPDVSVRVQGDLVEFESATPDLRSWGAA